MNKMVFINFPVADLKVSTAFYESLKATKNPQFSDDRTACMVLSDTIYVMLLTRERYREFTARPLGDAKTQSQALIALSVNSKAEVDEIVDAAAKAHGTADPNPGQDYGFMYSRSVEDPDGNVWELVWMDPAATAGNPPA